jgi:transposase-like protein
MEVSNNSVTGRKRYTREFKRLVVKKRHDENWTWLRTVEWIEEEYGIKISRNTINKWIVWCREEQKGRVGKSSSEGYNRAKHWQPQEDVILKECIEEGLANLQIVDFMNDTPELNYRRYTLGSITNRKKRLGIKGAKAGLAAGVRETKIKECKKILQKYPYSLVEYINSTAIKVQCDSCNYVWQVNRYNFGKTSCPKCRDHNFAGGMPTGPEPALVYLLYFKEIDNYKLGYAEIGKSSFPEEAIHRTSKSRKYPWSYEIVAYDLSTKTNAGIHEQNLLKDTFDSRTFIETQEFDGWTEFRTPETIKQLKKKGEFETWLI